MKKSNATGAFPRSPFPISVDAAILVFPAISVLTFLTIRPVELRGANLCVTNGYKREPW